MKRFGSVKFDFNENKVQLGRTWVNVVDIKKGEYVRMVEKTSIPARSEQVITVRCKKKYAMLDADIEPRKLIASPGIFVSKARVVPNINGVFQVTVLNVSDANVTLSNRQIIGSLHQASKVV